MDPHRICPECGKIFTTSVLTCDCGCELINVDIERDREISETKEYKNTTCVKIVDIHVPFFSVFVLVFKVVLSVLLFGFIFSLIWSMFLGAMVTGLLKAFN
jgi:hypothetical protein